MLLGVGVRGVGVRGVVAPAESAYLVGGGRIILSATRVEHRVRDACADRIGGGPAVPGTAVRRTPGERATVMTR
ncbi:hypothetical protein PSA01_66230 [Pseudonocardia saturnea]|uniref:Uncharacterized protein n=1 Tax=Pseudonocardia saturnea TaxID=33909 RepID=A0ABQ0S9K3_9PSEU|nr:hypothetical protein Pdca_45760 [Pseudonocardia autotrophica]GEC29594.1 hypothetical protein PSA01_66230 [Pseudonocardia saturnea]